MSKLRARSLVLDGEVAIFDQPLRSRFEWLREPDPDAVATPPMFMVFDLLHRNRRELTGYPLRDRRARLEDLVADNDLVLLVRRLAPNGFEAWSEVAARDYEGLVAKDESSLYEAGPTRRWLKVKQKGWTDQRGRATLNVVSRTRTAPAIQPSSGRLPPAVPTEVFMRLIGLLLALGLILAPLAGEAREVAKVARVGILSVGSDPKQPLTWQPFLDAMRELGYVEGRNLTVNVRWVAVVRGDLPGLVENLVRSEVDVIVTTGTRESPRHVLIPLCAVMEQ